MGGTTTATDGTTTRRHNLSQQQLYWAKRAIVGLLNSAYFAELSYCDQWTFVNIPHFD
jgi:hypothetical protein